MKLALLGTDDDLLALAEAAVAGGHAIVWLGDVRSEDAATLARLVPGLTAAADWESLLGQGIADAVLVGRGTVSDELRAEQLKRLVSDAVPLLVVHPTGSSVLPYYELDMGRGEIHSVLRHYNPVVGSPSVAQLTAWVQTGSGEIGTVHQIVCQRFVADCGRESVLGQLARDVELLRELTGAIRTVSAVGPKSRDATYASLQAQMTAAGPATLRWSVTPTSAPTPHFELTLIGERGRATFRSHADEKSDEPLGAARLEIDGGGERSTRPAAGWQAARVAIDRLAAAIPASGRLRSEAASTWRDATAAMEVVDAIELSLEKGRTIEVYPQQLTEQLAFRGTMSAFGCGLLLLVPLVLVVAGVFGNAIGLDELGFWPSAVLLVLAVFLCLQAVPWLVTKRPPSGAGGEPQPPEHE